MFVQRGQLIPESYDLIKKKRKINSWTFIIIHKQFPSKLGFPIPLANPSTFPQTIPHYSIPNDVPSALLSLSSPPSIQLPTKSSRPSINSPGNPAISRLADSFVVVVFQSSVFQSPNSFQFFSPHSCSPISRKFGVLSSGSQVEQLSFSPGNQPCTLLWNREQMKRVANNVANCDYTASIYSLSALGPSFLRHWGKKWKKNGKRSRKEWIIVEGLRGNRDQWIKIFEFGLVAGSSCEIDARLSTTSLCLATSGAV